MGDYAEDEASPEVIGRTRSRYRRRPLRSYGRKVEGNLTMSPPNLDHVTSTPKQHDDSEVEEVSTSDLIESITDNKTDRTSDQSSHSETKDTKTRDRSGAGPATCPGKGIDRFSFLTLILAVVVAVAFVKCLPTLREYFSRPRYNVSQFRDAMNSLKSAFPAQSKRTWSTLEANLKRVLKPESHQAACFLVAPASEKDVKVSDCFALAVSDVFSRVATGSWKMSDFRPRADFQGAMRSVSKEGLSGNSIQFRDAVDGHLTKDMAVAVLQLDALNGSTALAFHEFCDNSESAKIRSPFSNSAVLGTLHTGPLGSQEDAEQYLMDRWSETINEDRASSIVSRFAGTIFVTSEEKGPSFRNLICPDDFASIPEV